VIVRPVPPLMPGTCASTRTASGDGPVPTRERVRRHFRNRLGVADSKRADDLEVPQCDQGLGGLAAVKLHDPQTDSLARLEISSAGRRRKHPPRSSTWEERR